MIHLQLVVVRTVFTGWCIALWGPLPLWQCVYHKLQCILRDGSYGYVLTNTGTHSENVSKWNDGMHLIQYPQFTHISIPSTHLSMQDDLVDCRHRNDLYFMNCELKLLV